MWKSHRIFHTLSEHATLTGLCENQCVYQVGCLRIQWVRSTKGGFIMQFLLIKLLVNFDHFYRCWRYMELKILIMKLYLIYL